MRNQNFPSYWNLLAVYNYLLIIFLSKVEDYLSLSIYHNNWWTSFKDNVSFSSAVLQWRNWQMRNPTISEQLCKTPRKRQDARKRYSKSLDDKKVATTARQWHQESDTARKWHQPHSRQQSSDNTITKWQQWVLNKTEAKLQWTVS